MKVYTCPACKEKVTKRVSKNLCPHCKVAIEYVGPLKQRRAILAKDKEGASLVIGHLQNRIEEHKQIKLYYSRQDYIKEVGIYYSLVIKCRALLERNDIMLDVPSFIIWMIDITFGERSFTFIADNITSLSFITGKMFNRIAIIALEEEKQRRAKMVANKRKLADIKMLERNPANGLI